MSEIHRIVLVVAALVGLVVVDFRLMHRGAKRDAYARKSRALGKRPEFYILIAVAVVSIIQFVEGAYIPAMVFAVMLVVMFGVVARVWQKLP